MSTKNYNHMVYNSWDNEWDWNIFFVILDHFLPFYPSNNLENKILKKRKKHLEMSSFYMCPKNHDHMMYAFWDMECDWQTFLSFWTILYPSSPLMTQNIKILKKILLRCNLQQTDFLVILGHFCQENQNFKKWKKDLDISSFYISVPKLMIILFLRHGTWQI